MRGDFIQILKVECVCTGKETGDSKDILIKENNLSTLT